MYVIHETPVPLARPRFGKNHVYDGQKIEKMRDAISIKLQHNGKPMHEQPIHLDVEFAFPFPKRFTKKQKDFWKGKPHHSKPDLDNLVKYLADICMGILYNDDTIISSVSAKKIFQEQGYTKFMIRDL